MALKRPSTDEEHERWALLAEHVEAERSSRIGSKLEAHKRFEGSPTTYDKVENGEYVISRSWAAVERLLGWRNGSCLRYLRHGGELPGSTLGRGADHVVAVSDVAEDAEGFFTARGASTDLEQLNAAADLVRELARRIAAAADEQDQ